MYCCHNCDRLYVEAEQSSMWVNAIYPHEQNIEICPYCGVRVDNLLWGEEEISEDELLEMLEGLKLKEIRKLRKEKEIVTKVQM